MARLVIDLDDALYEVLVALARERGCSVEEEISSLLAEAGWREQAGMEAARRLAEDADVDASARAREQGLSRWCPVPSGPGMTRPGASVHERGQSHRMESRVGLAIIDGI